MSDSLNTLFEDLVHGDRIALSKAITLVESSLPSDQNKILILIEKAFKLNKKSKRIAITGAPGIGKSTFINSLVQEMGKDKIAVLSIDPSSTLTGGSILGDKTRMQEIINFKHVYIRPSPSRAVYGGVNAYTYNAILLCEAAGYETIIIETVGVGQSEINVRSLCDFLLYVTMASTGDDLQGIKRGIMEQVDAVVINKIDAVTPQKIQETIHYLKQAFSFTEHPMPNWEIEIHTCSATENQNTPQIYGMILQFFERTAANGFLDAHRKTQLKIIFEYEIQSLWLKKLYTHTLYQNNIEHAIQQVTDQRVHPFIEANALINQL